MARRFRTDKKSKEIVKQIEGALAEVGPDDLGNMTPLQKRAMNMSLLAKIEPFADLVKGKDGTSLEHWRDMIWYAMCRLAESPSNPIAHELVKTIATGVNSARKFLTAQSTEPADDLDSLTDEELLAKVTQGANALKQTINKE
jgi:hypothetical protein